MSRSAILVVFCAALMTAVGAGAQAPPPPVFDHIGVQATCTFDPQSQTYRYQYMVTNPPTNTLELWSLELSLGLDGSLFGTIQKPEDWSGWMSDPRFVDNPARFPRKPYISWCSSDKMVNPPSPGTTSGPFAFSVYVPPAISELWVSPWTDPYWDAYMQATGDDEVPLEVSVPLELSLIRKVPTLGPLGVSPGSFEHWDTFISDVAKAGQLGWISDAALLSGMQSNLAAARQAAVAQDPATTNAKLQAVIDAISASTPAQRTNEGYALVYYNAQYLQQNIPWPCEPKLVAAPANATHPVGETHTVTATLVNVATGLPIANNTLYFQVTEGPNAGLASETQTDTNGKATFSFIGTTVGTDTIIVHTPYGTIKQTGMAASKTKAAVSAPSSITDCMAWDITAEAVHVTWKGGPDLTVPLFVPPMLISSPGKTFYVTEWTNNVGNLPAGPSITRYYLSTVRPVDPATAIVVGQRSVPALAPGEESTVTEVPFTVPTSLPAGTYYLDACADAENQLVETNETNNCASSTLNLVVGMMPRNRPPDCSKAAASPGMLWPPNHKLTSIAITGVTDPDGDPVTVNVTGITQDEPLNGLGDGDTCPDGFGVGTGHPQVRAERSGLGNGRLYKISFTASDENGSTCSGAITVGVPHDKKDTPIDDGQKYDSTKCP